MGHLDSRDGIARIVTWAPGGGLVSAILKDNCGAGNRETEAVVRWMMDAMVEASLRGTGHGVVAEEGPR